MQQQRHGSYSDHMAAVTTDAWRHRIGNSTGIGAPFIRARLRAKSPPDGAAILRGGHLDAYLAETISEDSLRGGPGSRLDIVLGPETPRWMVAEVTSIFAWLRRRGIQLTVHPHRHEPLIARSR